MSVDKLYAVNRGFAILEYEMDNNIVYLVEQSKQTHESRIVLHLIYSKYGMIPLSLILNHEKRNMKYEQNKKYLGQLRGYLRRVRVDRSSDNIG